MLRFDPTKDYSSGEGGKFLQLKNDGDSIKGRFLYGALEDIPIYNVKKAPTSDRPFAKAITTDDDPEGKLMTALLFEEEATGKLLYWGRGVSFLKKLATISKVRNTTDLSSIPVTIVREGAAGSLDTKYMLIPAEQLKPNPVTPEQKELADAAGQVVYGNE